MESTGCCMGKFHPFHNGHKFLFEQAVKSCDRLYIIVVYLPAENPQGWRRAAWIKECFPEATVLCKEDVFHTESSRTWAQNTIDWLGFRPDLVFTSETYGEPWARELNDIESYQRDGERDEDGLSTLRSPCRHVLVDMERISVPCSGTLVRSNPIKHWQFLPRPVRGFFAQRVVLVGAESTGKTTLCKQLAKVFDAPWVPEYGAECCEEQLDVCGGTLEDLPNQEFSFSVEDFRSIIRAQAAREEEAARNSHGLVFCDTNIFASILWFQRYVSEEVDEEFLDEVGDLLVPPSLYLFMTTDDAPFVQNGIRDGEQIRIEMNERFKQVLAKGYASFPKCLDRLKSKWLNFDANPRVVTLDSKLCDRFATARSVIDDLLNI